MTKNEGRTLVEKLVNDFEQNETNYLKRDFQETEVRSRFIDPFFTALGWDFNQTNIAKNHWDVHREFSQRDNSTSKRPDYAFRISNGGKHKVKFFVEAKAPWVKLTNLDAIYQAKRYAFSSHGKTPIVILTDFQEFRVFNGFEKPVYNNPLQGLINEFDIGYKDYVKNWNRIWDMFSRDAVKNGSISVLAGEISKSTRTLDDEFLADISSWRESLAKHLALNNATLTVEELNEGVQRIIDRLVFIRNLEDRGIEAEDTLLNYANNENVYKNLIPLFRTLDNEYNGLLFKKHFSEDLSIDDRVISDQIKKMCYPLSPYQFDEIEPEILGRIYERFLGSKIKLTGAHSVKIEEKLEVRKAGGVYYTPQYVVDYIVKHTVGEMIKNKSPEDISHIKICDPACGSGSFLLGAYDFLITYHKEWYKNLNKKEQKDYKSDFYFTSDKEIQLTLKKRSEILKNNIFGVDIDREATEVSIMSLYLKLLDNGFDKGQVEIFMRGHILPDMTNNIKCGNSLIDIDYGQQMTLSIEKKLITQKNVKPFSFQNEFISMHNGGFNVIIGNPPYGADILEEHQAYLANQFESYEYQLNTFSFFIEKGISLLAPRGVISYIIPAVLHNQHYFSKIRKLMLSKTQIDILHLLKYRVFEQAEIGDTMIFVAKRSSIQQDASVTFKTTHNCAIDDAPIVKLQQTEFANNARFEFLPGVSNPILKKAYQISVMLSKVASCVMGVKPYQTGKGKPKQTKQVVIDRPFDSAHKIDDSYKQYIIGKDIQRYKIDPKEKRFIKYGIWLAEPRPDAPFEREKIVCRQTADHIIAALDSLNYYNLNNVYNIEAKNDVSNYYLLGLFNSKLFRYFYYEIVGERKRVFAEVKKVNLEKLPICISKKGLIKQLEEKIKQLLALHSRLMNLKSEIEVTSHTKLINSIDTEIDAIVYEIYNISADEKAIIENALL